MLVEDIVINRWIWVYHGVPYGTNLYLHPCMFGDTLAVYRALLFGRESSQSLHRQTSSIYSWKSKP